MFFKIAVCGVAFVSNVGDFWAGSTSVERETLRLGVYLIEYQLVKQHIGVIPPGAIHTLFPIITDLEGLILLPVSRL